jgi:hypothetical protein
LSACCFPLSGIPSSSGLASHFIPPSTTLSMDGDVSSARVVTQLSIQERSPQNARSRAIHQEVSFLWD